MTLRSCGPCTACCTACQVSELQKPANVPCVHLRADPPGCARYDSRPPSCQRFACEWLQGYGDDNDRPDLSGVVFSAHQHPGGMRYLVLIELREGAALNPFAIAHGTLARHDGLAVVVKLHESTSAVIAAPTNYPHDYNRLIADLNLPPRLIP